MARLTSLTVSDLLGAFASADPLPAGGSAAALAAAAGAALLVKVATLPLKRQDPEVAAARADAATRLQPLCRTLAALVDRDSEAYARVLAAYKLPRTTGEETSRRRDAVAAAMRAATDPPLEMMRACREVLRNAATVAETAPKAAVADVGAAVELIAACLRSAAGGVDSNLDALGEHADVAPVREERTRLESESVREIERAQEVVERRGR